MSSFFHRKATQKLSRLLKDDSSNPPVLLVEGPRQVGKTTVVELCLNEIKTPSLRINLETDLRYRHKLDQCEEFGDFTQWLEDEFQFKPDGSTILFIDEAQESRQLGKFVRFMKEEWNHTRVILTGSMMSRLFRDETRYPVGRVKTILIQPLSFFEFLEAKNKKHWVDLIEKGKWGDISTQRHEALLSELNTYFQTGGLPRVVKAHLNNENIKEELTEIYESYRNDFIRVFGEDQAFLFQRALRAVSDHVGSPSKFSQAAQPDEPHYKKMEEIFSRLELWRMIHTCIQRGPQPEGTTLFHPKRYFFDMGLLHFLRAAALPDFHLVKTLNPAQRTPLGGVLENQVAFDLINQKLELEGWKKNSSGPEVDFIVKTENKTWPLECKASLKVKEPHLKGIKTYMKEYGLKTGILASLAPFEKRTYPFGTIFMIPVYAINGLVQLMGKCES